MAKGQVLLITSVLLMQAIFLLPSFIYTPVKALDYGMDTDLGNVDASFWGEDADDGSGCSVAGVGDVNGDGYDDILIGARYDDDGGNFSGQTYLIFGKASGWIMDSILSRSDASFWGENAGDRSGSSVAGAGDVNGDGYDDLLIGAPYNDEGDSDAGQTYLIFGKPSGWAMDTNLSASNASFLGGSTNDGAGWGIAGAGDVNGDEYDDILIGAPSKGDGGTGQTYLILGKDSGWTMDTNLSASDASFLGEDSYDNSGYSVAGAGDVNGDGFDDILIGASNNCKAGVRAGQTYLILGKASGWAMNTVLSASDASFLGEDAYNCSGCSVAGAGDANGDGYDDILIGAHGNNDYDREIAGQTYLILGKASGWEMDTDLSASDASFIGEDTDDYSGSSVAGAGDINGDGYDDILIGASGVYYAGESSGHTYFILGKPSDWTMNIALSASDASFIGEYKIDYSGCSVAGAGDVNGDGYDDILIGAYANSEGGTLAGQTYLIFNKDFGWAMDIDLSASDASFWGENEVDWSGLSVDSAGDVNGDGYDDILIGAIYNDDGGAESGQTYLILGKGHGWAMDIDLSKANASFIGEDAEDYSGVSVAGAGDVNSDGYDDILIGARSNDEGGDYAGQTYLIFGKASGWSMDTDLSTSDASFLGESEGDSSGCSVAGAGDVNGDGYDDILIGATGNDDGGDFTGQTYLIFGKASGWAMDTNLSASDASFWGENQGGQSGSSVAGAGDFNGDGYDDILIGAHLDDDGGTEAGQTYLIFGKSSGWTMDTNLSTSDASFWGESSGDHSGFSVAGGGDVNDDDYDDILIGAWFNDKGGTDAGQTYLIFGKSSGWTMDANLSDSDASFWRECQAAHSGHSVAGAGDVNGDGYDDILIGAYSDQEVSDSVGQTYLILGKNFGWSMYTSLSASDASFLGEEAWDWSGYSVAGGGDINGDGYDDLLIGACCNDEGGDRVGQTYLILLHPNTRPILYDENHSPSNGDTFTNFTFSIMYKDIDSDKPVNISLVINNEWYAMLSNDSIPLDFRMGVRYNHTLNLLEGVHRYYYYTSDGKSMARFPEHGYLTTPDIPLILWKDNEKDSDGDGHNDTYEYIAGSDPNDEESTPFDWDGDGWNNSIETENESDPSDEKSTPLDWDGDGWNNSIETEAGADPRDYSSFPRDLDGDWIPDSIDPDRDGDKVVNVNDAYPDDPNKWESDTDSDPEDYLSISKWVGIAIFVIFIVIIVFIIYIVKKKRIGNPKESETGDLGRVGKED